MKIFSLFLLAMTLTTISPAAPGMRETLEQIRAKHNLIALGGAIVRVGQPPEIATTGLRKKGAPDPVTNQDLWHIGSEAKAMTAAAIAIMVEEGQLTWTQTIGESFPELSATMNPDYRDVTLRQLLDHRAGITPDLVSLPIWSTVMTDTKTPAMEQRKQFAAVILAMPPISKPGTKYEYTNADYMLAAMMAERAAKKPWEDLIREKLYEPLGMKTPGIGPPGEGDLIDQPWGHTVGLFLTTPSRRDNPRCLSPAGTVHMSLADWSRFIAFEMGGHAVNAQGKPLLSQKTLAEIQTPIPGADYACGWIVAQRDWGGTVLTHSGSNTMWYAVAWVSREKKTAVLVVTNQVSPETYKAADEACAALLKIAGLIP